MSIALFRIDDRLIHGQVVEGWLNHTDANMIVVANDIVANDIMQKTLMQMAVPSNIEIIIDTIDKVSEFFKIKENNVKKILLLVSSPKDAYKLIESGLKVSSINVGGIHYCEGKIQILEFLSVDENDCKYFHQIAKKDVKIEGRPLPSSERIDVLKGICKFESNKD